MTLILAENLNGWLAAAAAFFAALLASLLALVALVPAARGKRGATLGLAAPAFIIGVLLTAVLIYQFVTASMADPGDYSLRDFVVPWLVMAGPPLATSLLAVAVLWVRGKPAGA